MSSHYEAALRDFDRARKEARLQQLLARLRGGNADLLAWHDVCAAQIPLHKQAGIQEIPLDAIVGSVGRYNDFTRDFLPRKDSGRERWTGVRLSLDQMKGWPPIEVYQVGEVYFVNDGNHRVSVARQLNSGTIAAYVTEVELDAPITAADDADTIIGKARYASFAAVTHIGRVLPTADLRLTFHTQYDFLLDSIRAYAQLHQLPDALGAPAVQGWYAHVYQPICAAIRANGTARAFPHHTEADMYVLLIQHQASLRDTLGWQVDPVVAAADLPQRTWWQRLKRRLIPADFVDGPATGQWRKQRKPLRQQLFRDVMVTLEDSPSDWHLLEQAIWFSTKKEKNRLYGLAVIDGIDTDQAAAEKIRDRFLSRTAEAGLEAQFAIETGTAGDIMISRAHWADLVMTNLTGPFRDSPIKPGFERLIQQSPTPIWVVRDGVSGDCHHALLGYDGSPKAQEALFMATWLAGRWEMALTVVTVETDRTAATVLDDARRYLTERDIAADFILKPRPITDALLAVAAEKQCDLIIIGGYGFSPLRQTVTSSTVDHLIKQSNLPLLICR